MTLEISDLEEEDKAAFQADMSLDPGADHRLHEDYITCKGDGLLLARQSLQIADPGVLADIFPVDQCNSSGIKVKRITASTAIALNSAAGSMRTSR